MKRTRAILIIIGVLIAISALRLWVIVEHEETQRKVEYLKKVDAYIIEFFSNYIEYAGKIKDMNVEQLADYATEDKFKGGLVSLKNILDDAEKTSNEYGRDEPYYGERQLLLQLVMLTVISENYKQIDTEEYKLTYSDGEIEYAAFGMSEEEVNTLRIKSTNIEQRMINLQNTILENVDQYVKDLPDVKERLADPETPYEDFVE